MLGATWGVTASLALILAVTVWVFCAAPGHASNAEDTLWARAVALMKAGRAAEALPSPRHEQAGYLAARQLAHTLGKAVAKAAVDGDPIAAADDLFVVR